MSTEDKAKSPAPPAAPETSSEAKETTSEVASTVAPTKEAEVPAATTDSKSPEPSKHADALADPVPAKPSEDAEKSANDEEPPKEPAPQEAEDNDTTQTTVPLDNNDRDDAPAISPITEANRPSRAAAQKAQEATKPRTPAKKKSSANLSGAAAASSANKRKSFGGKAGPDMALKPGMIVLARLKGYSPWPAIIVEDDMLPDSVKNARPKDSTSKRKGKFSMSGMAEEDIPLAARGSSAGHWPIMFLDNFESFAWTMFTEIMPLDQTAIDAFSPRGKAKDIVKAYENAKKGYSLEDIRNIKADAYNEAEEEEEAEAMDVDEPEEEEEEEIEVKAPKGKKKAAPAKESSSKKRKAEEEVEDTSKTPKKQNTGKNPKTPASSKAKTPINGASKKKAAEETPAPKSSKKRTAAVASEEEDEIIEKSAKKKTKGAEKKAVEKDDTPDEATSSSAKAKNLTVEKDQKEKEVMYLRHKIQKALLTTDKVPTEAEVVNIDHYFQKLESYPKLEVAIIKKTKINKVLKALLRLASIPFDEKYKFKDRTLKMLDEWNQLLANDPETSGAEPNGVRKGSTSGKERAAKSPEFSGEPEKQGTEEPKEKIELSGSDAKEGTESVTEKEEKAEAAAPAEEEASAEDAKEEAAPAVEASKEVAAEA